MLFNSFTFLLVFLPVALSGFFLTSILKTGLGILFLAFASLCFYAYWDVRFVPLLIASILINYLIGSAIAIYVTIDRVLAKTILIIGLALNLSCIGYWKYANWFVDNFNLAFGMSIENSKIILPLGISFYTFTQIAYLVDIFRQKCSERSLSNYFLFVTYFPHLIAGPILHHSEMMPQFADSSNKRISLHNITLGLILFLIGVIKKTVFADTVSPIADRVFDGTELLSTVEAWSGSLAYTVQIYFDFSGYTDMALGLSRMFNINLPINFNSPYKAKSMVEFWRRWHMTLSRFLRDYLYIPLGGNRSGAARRYLNLFLTMLLGGIWHGAGWTFLIWGALHGLYLIVDHSTEYLRSRLNIGKYLLLSVLGQFVTFIAVVIGWVFFRATSFSSATRVLCGMINWSPGETRTAIEYSDGLLSYLSGAVWSWIVGLLVLTFFFPNSQQIVAWTEARLRTKGQAELRMFLIALCGFALTSILFVISISRMRHATSPFIYFNF
jgi:alginate O-acetyltransferase complex protein AlgI